MSKKNEKKEAKHYQKRKKGEAKPKVTANEITEITEPRAFFTKEEGVFWLSWTKIASLLSFFLFPFVFLLFGEKLIHRTGNMNCDMMIRLKNDIIFTG